MPTLIHSFNQHVLSSPVRLAMPIATYPGLALTRATVRDIVTDPGAQVETQVALQQRYQTSIVMSAMDLSVEAEAFGCPVAMSDTEVPTVTGHLVSSPEQAGALSVPAIGTHRTGVYLETVRRLRKLSDAYLVLGGCIGPFSLAARLTGVSEAMELTVTDPAMMHAILERSTEFLIRYVKALRQAGADGVIMAEPAAGLLSPRSLATFSSAYVRRLAEAVADESLSIILHNCGAKLFHLPAILETGLKTFHFGAPMDLVAALGKVGPEVVLCGNLDPAGVFCQLPPAEITTRVAALLSAGASYRNFVISSGCDVPPDAPLASLDALFEAAKSPNAG